MEHFRTTTPRWVHELFEAQAAQTPAGLAVVLDGQLLTYSELNTRSNQLAQHLRQLGVGPEVLVGVCLERSLELVVGSLGILKAGGVYLPLDPASPPERLALMLEDAQPLVLLTQQRLIERLPAQRAQIVCLDTDWPAVAQHPAEPPPSAITGDHLAYVIYTSGSTGRPKGVQILHGALASFLTTVRALYGLGLGDRLLQFASLSFDTSVEEIFGCLTSGATLVLRTDALLGSITTFLGLCAEWGITMLDLPTAYWHELAAHLPAASLRLPETVRLVIIGGEQALAERLGLWCAHVDPGVGLLNTYGPTEATVVATAWAAKCADLAAPGSGAVPIGWPLGHTQAYVLDEGLQPVLAGAAGELYLGGASLARGYLGRPELTAERFIPNPFAGRDGISGVGYEGTSHYPIPDTRYPGARLYRTGDRVRLRADGALEYLGRRDRQIKLRGYRIELEELEWLLRGYPGVEEALVVLRGAGSAARLVGYVQDSAAAVTAEQLQAYLRTRVPEYMLPSALVVLGALPLTANGKLDREALPDPELWQEAEQHIEAPQTPLERQLAHIWAEVLQLAQVGRHDNFFALGGHSLLATQMLSRVRAAFGVELPLQMLFEAPTVAALTPYLAGYQMDAAADVAAPLVPVSRDRPLPLSFAQQRLWVLDQLSPANAAYYLPSALRLSGRLDVTTLDHSLDDLTQRHEALRTTFVLVDGQPTQQIHPAQPADLAVVDLQTLPVSEQPGLARQHLADAARQPFDLARGPLLRAVLLRVAPEEHVLLIITHHIVSDGWSVEVLFAELAERYAAHLSGSAPPLRALPVQYADFAIWQRDWLQGSLLERQLDYWTKRLAGAPPALELPTDRPRPPAQTLRGARHRFEIADDQHVGLKRLCQREGATLFMALLAVFGVLLRRYTGQTDLLIGTPIANRTRLELEALIGFFVNTLVVRLDLSDDLSFQELLRRTRATCLEAFAHQDLPFERLVEALQPERDLSRTPLVQVMFGLQNAPAAGLELPGLRVEPVEVESDTAQFELTLTMEETKAGLVGCFEYSTDIFQAPTIQRLAHHYQTLMAGIVGDAAARVDALSLLSAQERGQLLDGWNQTQAAYPTDQCVHELFEAQVARAPDALAVACGSRRLTYHELNLRANRLAHLLRRRGVGPETLVGICLDRSPEFVVALLAVLKAGGAYVPLDSAYPAGRLAFMAQDAGLALVLTKQALAGWLPDQGVQGLYLDTAWPESAAETSENPVSGAGPANLAYVIYTSGSTGVPKGVAIQHASLLNLICWHQRSFGLSPADRATQVASPAFDAAVWELWPYLTVGASIHIVDEATRLSSADLCDWLTDQRITLSFLPTPLAERLISQDRYPAHVRMLLIGGDLLRLRPSADSPFVLVNNYGPTECTVVATSGLVAPDQQDQTLPLIGRPIANTQAYVLDERLQPVPLGVVGELYLGGVGLARGYLGQPDRTAAAFVPHPFSATGGARLYRTGDRVRMHADGALEFVGRRDRQVKLRGYRIELEEIERLLRIHPGVQEAAVVLLGTGPAARLLGYVQAAPQAVTVKQLEDYLRERVPEYMVPTALTILELLPLTANGKLDREALPEPEAQREARAHMETPQTPLERQLAQIWAEVLQVAQVGRHDNFFARGGHSLQAAQIVARVQELFQIELSLRSLFEAPTVAALAVVIAQGQAEQSADRPAASVQAKHPEDLLDQIDDLSDEEIDELLRQMLSEGE